MSQHQHKDDPQQQARAGRLVTIARFASSPEAGWHCSRLEAAGTKAAVQGGASREMLSYYGTAVADIQLQVAEQDAAQAREILGISDGRQAPSEISEPDASPETWACPRCGNRVEDGFEICWSCGTAFDEEPRPAAASKRETIACPLCGADVPTTCDECPKCGELLDQDSDDFACPDAEIPEPDVVEKTLNRAWRSAILGIALLPPILNIYSSVLLGRYHKLLSQTGRRPSRRAAVISAINAVVLISFAALWLFMKS